MKIILFDLGGTLEQNDVLLPGARDTLTALTKLRDKENNAPALALISDFTMPSTPNATDEIAALRNEYLAILDGLDIRAFFEPVDERITLSSEVGVFKPKKKIFEAAVHKISESLTFADIFFITENKGHVEAARDLGMQAVHLKGPGQASGEIETLPDLLPLVSEFLAI